tara:strand:- start:750 stop:1505 length:756 start_codon:yes stop_codon:yes gene_type:complete
MTSRLLLLVSIAILLVTTVVVALFGVVPLPEYETFASDKGFNGKLIYYVEFQSENIIPPAPDIMDSCIFFIDLSVSPAQEKEVVCNSDLYNISNDISFYDAQIHNDDQILLSYWDYQISNDRKVLIVDIESGIISESMDVAPLSENNRMNVYGEKLIEPWETTDYNSRLIGVYYVNRIDTVEVYNSRAPSNYYFESLHWSPDGDNIVAGDSENNLIIFSKRKLFTPVKIPLSYEKLDDERVELINVLGWTN